MFSQKHQVDTLMGKLKWELFLSLATSTLRSFRSKEQMLQGCPFFSTGMKDFGGKLGWKQVTQEEAQNICMPSKGQVKLLGRLQEMPILLDAVKDLALQAVLDLATPHHQLQHLVDSMLRIFLGGRKDSRESVKPTEWKKNKPRWIWKGMLGDLASSWIIY